MNRWKRLWLCSLVLFATTLVGCAPTFRGEFNKLTKGEGWNEKEWLAAYQYAVRLVALDEGEHGEYHLKHHMLTKADVRRRLDLSLEDFGTILSNQNESWTRYNKVHNLRPHFEHEEKVMEARLARVRADELNFRFMEYTGQVSSFHPAYKRLQGYDPRVLLEENLSQTFPFVMPKVLKARADGQLLTLQTLTTSFHDEYAYTIPNPANRWDRNDRLWRPETHRLSLALYKIHDLKTMPRVSDNNGDYLEVYRLKPDGQREGLPCLRVIALTGGYSAVVVIDYDKEGEPGFGMPDDVQRVGGLRSVKDVVRNDGLLALLYQRDKDDDRVPPKEEKLFVSVVSAREELDLWQYTDDPLGWPIPYDYRKDSNYNVRVKWQKKEHYDLKRPEDKLRKVQWVQLEWTAVGQRRTWADGQVITYHKVKPEFAGLLAKAEEVEEDWNRSVQKLRFEFQSGQVREGRVVPDADNPFIVAEPFAVSFRIGNQWWWLEKKDPETSKVFEKRKEWSEPKGQLGSYSSYSSYGGGYEYSSGHHHDDY